LFFASYGVDSSRSLTFAHWMQNMAKFMEDAQNPEFQQVLEQAFRELGTDGARLIG